MAEELKKTRQSYTPFSHEKLREILENKICALKPIDEIENDKILDLWLNFLILNYIRVDKVDGTYCIESPVCGKRLTDQLQCRKDILILGTTRSEAFETFQRYCGELIKEKKANKNIYTRETISTLDKNTIVETLTDDEIKQLIEERGLKQEGNR